MASAVANLKSAGAGNEHFNDDALLWDTRPFVREASEEAKKALVARWELSNWHPKQVMELGCGTGILSFLVAPYVERVVAIDAAEGMINVLEKKLKGPNAPNNILPVCVLLEDAEDRLLPPADTADPDGPRQKFDLITSHLVLHHIPDLKSVLQTMHDCLAPGGRVMLSDFENFGPDARRFHPESRMDGVVRHGIPVDEMASMMQEVGFHDVKVDRAWEMTKNVEKFPGAFGVGEKQWDDSQGEEMKFPFLICYGRRQ